MRKVSHSQLRQGRCEPLIDDVAAKPPSRSTYPDEITGLPEESAITDVRRYILEAIQALDEVLADIERAGGTISGLKSAFICEGLRIVAFVCDAEGLHPEAEKVRKVVEWPPCRSVTEAKAFIGLCVYYRAWNRDFSVVAEPIFHLFRRGRSSGGDLAHGAEKTGEEKGFRWAQEQERAMEGLKAALVSTPALKT